MLQKYFEIFFKHIFADYFPDIMKKEYLSRTLFNGRLIEFNKKSSWDYSMTPE